MISTTLPARIGRAICEHSLFVPGETVIVALSGGADSTALLRILADLPDFPLELVAAHLNHCLRGAESDADEDFARKLALELGIPFENRRVDVRALAAAERINLEDAGRRARYEFLDEIKTIRRAGSIALAHHSDDQAETFLMRLLRGSGATGLSAMAFRNLRGCVRPLLGISRSEIESYLRDIGQPWREDSSNRDVAFLRNRIRCELLPLLEDYNPSVRKTLVATAHLLADEDALLEELALKAAEGVWRSGKTGIACKLPLLLDSPLPLQRRMVRQALSGLAGTLEKFKRQHIEAVLRLAHSSRPNARLKLPHNLVAIREYDELHLGNSGAPPCDDHVIQLDGPGVYRLPGGGLLKLEMALPPPDTGEIGPATAFFDLDQAPFPWLVRTFRPGDRITPLGMNNSKKVKNVFIDAKLAFSERRRTPLVFCGPELLWIAGLRRSQLARIETGSSRIVRATDSTVAGALNRKGLSQKNLGIILL